MVEAVTPVGVMSGLLVALNCAILVIVWFIKRTVEQFDASGRRRDRRLGRLEHWATRTDPSGFTPAE